MSCISVVARQAVRSSRPLLVTSRLQQSLVWSQLRTLSLVPEDKPEDAVQAYLQQHEITVSDPGAPPPVFSFEESELPPDILQKVSNDFSDPTPIQAQGLPIALSGKNMVGVAQTGSGKTLAFLLPALLHIRKELAGQREGRQQSAGPLALILAPTRELAQQIEQVAVQFRRLTRVKTVCCIGGESRGRQLSMYDRGAELMIATPGRINDFLEAGDMSLKQCGFVVLDEADRMLDMGFEPQVRSVLEQLKSERQTMMFSATWPEEVQDLAREFLGEYTFMNIGSVELSANKNITQSVVVCPRDYKQENFLNDMSGEMAGKKVLVFTERKATVDRIERMLRNTSTRAMGIHGDKSQRQRSETIQRFKDGSCQVMVATDVAARGLDISDVEYVVNYDFPLDIENYIHRIGRTGRANKKGKSITYITPEEGNFAKKLIEILREAVQEVPQELVDLANHAKTQKYDNKKVRGRLGDRRQRDYMSQKSRTQYGFRGLGNDDDEEGFRRNNRYGGGGDRGYGGRGGGDRGYGGRGGGNRGYGGRDERYGNRDQRETDHFGFDVEDSSESRFGSGNRDGGRRPTNHRNDDF